jgi:hypothetical protein
MSTITLVFILAVLVEGLMEYFGQTAPSGWKPYIAALVAVLLCIGYQADLLGELGYIPRFPLIGEILTGLVIGRGSNYLNDLWEMVRTKAVR